MMNPKKWIIFPILLSLLGAETPILCAEDSPIPEAAPEPEENPYGTQVLPPQSEYLSPSLESSDAPAEMGMPASSEEEEDENEGVTSKLILETQKSRSQ